MSEMKRLVENLRSLLEEVDEEVKSFGFSGRQTCDYPFETVETPSGTWALRYSVGSRRLNFVSGDYLFRGRRYQVKAHLNEREQPVVDEVAGLTGRATFAQPIRTAIESDLRRLAHQWLNECRLSIEAYRDEGLAAETAHAARILSKTIDGLVHDLNKLRHLAVEMGLPLENRRLFRELLHASGDADPEDVARIAMSLEPASPSSSLGVTVAS